MNDHFPDQVAELNMDEVDSVILDEVEADTYYCISRLLDGIQVGVNVRIIRGIGSLYY